MKVKVAIIIFGMSLALLLHKCGTLTPITEKQVWQQCIIVDSVTGEVCDTLFIMMVPTGEREIK